VSFEDLEDDGTEVTEADNLGFNLSWVCGSEDVTATWATDANLMQFVQTCSRFLPSLTENENPYTASDVRYDADTVGALFCYHDYDVETFDNDEYGTYDCATPTNADGEAYWTGAATIYAGAAVAIAATLF
jgi:hypothetical protein